jgi:hypothetical protein
VAKTVVHHDASRCPETAPKGITDGGVALAEPEPGGTVWQLVRASRSDRHGEFVERLGQPLFGNCLPPEFVVAAPLIGRPAGGGPG